MRFKRTALFSVLAMALGTAPARSAVLKHLQHGETAWEARAGGRTGITPRAEPAEEAVRAFEAALEEDPGSTRARVRLMKALYFLGEYATPDRREKLAIFERGRALAEEGIDRMSRGFSGDPRPKYKPGGRAEGLVGHLESEPEAAGVYMWGAIHWGLWGRHRGKIAAARQGVAGKIRDYAAMVIQLDETYENAGGHRVLGRLHAEAPKIPLITGWIDRRFAVSELETAVEMAPDDLLSRLYLIEALLEYDRPRKAEAMRLLRDLVSRQPNEDYLIEELHALRDARKLLASLDG